MNKRLHINFFLFFLLSSSLFAGTMQSTHGITRTNSIHVTSVITPLNQTTLVYIWLDVGIEENGTCQWKYIIQTNPSLLLRTGDTVPVSGDEIKNIVGSGYTCASLNFQRSEDYPVSRDYFLIKNNEDNSGYIGSEPFENTVTIQ